MTSKIKPNDGLERIELYKGGDSALGDRKDVAKLSSNENPLGAPPAAQSAFAEVAGQLHRYPSSDHSGLRNAIAEVHGLDPERIICGAGSDEIIAFLCNAYAGPGKQVIHTEHGFAMHKISALAAGAEAVEVRERDRTIDVDAILAACTDQTSIVFVANPANPTGTMLGDNEINRLVGDLPPHILLVLDGAYAEYVEGFDGGAALVEARENVFMTRTFSKIYGLGGARIGWGYGPAEIIDNLNRVRGPFNVTQATLAAAEAAVRDADWVPKNRAENARLLAYLQGALAKLGVRSDKSYTNFLLARFSDAEEAEACDHALREDGILVRRVTGYKLPNALRITIGTEAECERVVASVAQFKGKGQ